MRDVCPKRRNRLGPHGLRTQKTTLRSCTFVQDLVFYILRDFCSVCLFNRCFRYWSWGEATALFNVAKLRSVYYTARGYCSSDEFPTDILFSEKSTFSNKQIFPNFRCQTCKVLLWFLEMCTFVFNKLLFIRSYSRTGRLLKRLVIYFRQQQFRFSGTVSFLNP